MKAAKGCCFWADNCNGVATEWRRRRQMRTLTPAMTYRDTAEKLAIWSGQITELRQKMRDAQASIEPGPVHHYEFVTSERRKRLPHLFGRSRDLFVIHNMGPACPQCTLLADGFNGSYPHIADRPDTGFEQATISVLCGTRSICCRKVPPLVGRVQLPVATTQQKNTQRLFLPLFFWSALPISAARSRKNFARSIEPDTMKL